MESKHKILVCGDVGGKYASLFSRIENVNSKTGPFDFLLCVGNFFGDSNESLQPYISGIKKAPITTYILGPNRNSELEYLPEPNGTELAENIIYLGKRGLFTTSDGLQIAYLGGVEDKNVNEKCCITEDDVSRVINACVKGSSGYRGIDILLTSSWPAGVTQFDANQIENPPKGSRLIAKLAFHLKPRYHFCALERRFYERFPYKNHSDGDAVHTTRMFALADVGNKNKQRWLYAFETAPLHAMNKTDLLQMTTDATECPYAAVMNSLSKQKQFFFDEESMEKEERKRKHLETRSFIQERNIKVMNLDQSECWFCLASPKFEKHLVISLGDEVYLTLAKGSLTPDHVIISPISHFRTYVELTDSIHIEIQKFKTAIKNYCKETNQIPVIFERNYRTSHYQLQIVPIPERIADKDLIEKCFLSMAKDKSVMLVELPDSIDIDDVLSSHSSYFYLELADSKRLHVIKKHFPLQFAREVLSSEPILNCPEKIEWKNCEMSKEEESELTEQFRKKFQPFDFTLN